MRARAFVSKRVESRVVCFSEMFYIPQRHSIRSEAINHPAAHSAVIITTVKLDADGERRRGEVVDRRENLLEVTKD